MNQEQKQQISFRAFKMEDFEILSDVIRQTWNYDKFCSPKTAAALGRAYLALCLTEQTYTCVALAGSRPVGIIMGKDIKSHKCPIRYRLKALRTSAALLLKKEGRLVGKFFSGISRANKQLLAESPVNYQGEVSFFALQKDFRGKNIGGQLFDRLLSYMNRNKINTFYLFTDTTCSYTFYEHQGMTRRGCKSLLLQTKSLREHLDLFIYDYCCKKN